MKARQKLAGGAVVVSMLLGGPSLASADPPGGRLSITTPDQSAPMRRGGSATEFSVAVPRGGRCSGDSRHKGIDVYSFLVPHGTDPHSINFATTLPSKWYGMYTETQYVMFYTEPDTAEVTYIPNNFVWSRLTPDLLLAAQQQSARWDAGLACVSPHGGVVQNYWSATFEFVRSHSDPNGFTWSVVMAGDRVPNAGTGLPSWTWLAFLAGGGLLALSGAFRYLAKAHSRAGGDAGGPETPGPATGAGPAGTHPEPTEMTSRGA